jgi:hypothetical protein
VGITVGDLVVAGAANLHFAFGAALEVSCGRAEGTFGSEVGGCQGHIGDGGEELGGKESGHDFLAGSLRGPFFSLLSVVPIGEREGDRRKKGLQVKVDLPRTGVAYNVCFTASPGSRHLARTIKVACQSRQAFICPLDLMYNNLSCCFSISSL